MHFLASKDLNKKEKKGVSYIEIYPPKIEKDPFFVAVLSGRRNKDKFDISGKSTYLYHYDCDEKKFVMYDKQQNIF